MTDVTITIYDREGDQCTFNGNDEWSNFDDMVYDIMDEFESEEQVCLNYFPYEVYSTVGPSRVLLQEVSLYDIANVFRPTD